MSYNLSWNSAMSGGPGWRAQQKEQRFSRPDTAYLKGIENKASLPSSKQWVLGVSNSRGNWELQYLESRQARAVMDRTVRSTKSL